MGSGRAVRREPMAPVKKGGKERIYVEGPRKTMGSSGGRIGVCKWRGEVHLRNARERRDSARSGFKGFVITVILSQSVLFVLHVE